MLGRDKGYDEAEHIVHQINQLLLRYEVKKSNALEWLKFARTVRTNCEIIELEAKIKLGIGKELGS